MGVSTNSGDEIGGPLSAELMLPVTGQTRRRDRNWITIELLFTSEAGISEGGGLKP